MTKPIRTLLILFMVCSSTFGKPIDLKITEKRVTKGMRSVKSRTVSAVIVHSTFNNSGGDKYDIDLIIKQFSRYGVSAHYIIGREGTIYRLVAENNISFHAGKSILPNGHRNLNAISIGIELMSSYDEAPTDPQIKALVNLTTDISKRHKIEYILRHSDIAPGRKTDPWNMDWEAFQLMVHTSETTTVAK